MKTKHRVGDWEADTITGTRHLGAIVSLVDRASKFVYLRKVGAKTAQEVGDVIVRCLEPVRGFVHTITADNGKEFSGHAAVSEELCAGFYFATPYHSWERGLNQHTNGLVREFFPKSKDLRKVDPREVKRVEELLNTRGRGGCLTTEPLPRCSARRWRQLEGRVRLCLSCVRGGSEVRICSLNMLIGEVFSCGRVACCFGASAIRNAIAGQSSSSLGLALATKSFVPCRSVC